MKRLKHCVAGAAMMVAVAGSAMAGSMAQQSAAPAPMAKMGSMSPHPLSSPEAIKRLKSAGYTPVGQLTMYGNYWIAQLADGKPPVRVDMRTGEVSQVPAK
jgi:hypothetical protein